MPEFPKEIRRKYELISRKVHAGNRQKSAIFRLGRQYQNGINSDVKCFNVQFYIYFIISLNFSDHSFSDVVGRDEDKVTNKFILQILTIHCE